MPDIVVSDPFTSGDPMSAAAVKDALVGVEGEPDSIGGMFNGFLDHENFHGGFAAGQEDIGHGQLTQGRLVARTVNCDFFEEVFPANRIEAFDVENPTDREVFEQNYRSIAGCGISFPTDRQAGNARAVKFFWHVSVSAVEENVDEDNPGLWAQIRMCPYLDGTPIRPLERRFRNIRKVGQLAVGDGEVYGLPAYTRFWSGHWTVTPEMKASGLWPQALTGLPGAGRALPTDPGWHTFGIRVSSSCKMVRVRACRLGYMLIY